MLKSLFGELTATPLTLRGAMPAFAATAVLDSTETRLSDDGRMLDRRQQDLFVTGSPAQAMREHLAQVQHANDVHTMTLLDPGRLWAPGVIRALSDATGLPVERLHLREQATLRILATLERTVVPRRGDATLKIYHADLSGTEGENLRVPLVLMERSQMAAVIVGPMQPHEIKTMLLALHAAVRQPTWRCESLVFLLPPNGAWIASQIATLDWPHQLHVQMLDEPLVGTSSVWNTLLAAWDRQRASVGHGSDAALVEARAVARELRALMHNEGLLGCALADATDGSLLAGESRDGTTDLVRAAAALAPVLRAHRLANAAMELADDLEEVIVINDNLCHLLRPLKHRPAHFLFARIVRPHANLALLSLKLADAERSLR
jgi:hypothetical protein